MTSDMEIDLISFAGGLFSRSFYEETHRTLTSGSLKNLKDMGNEKLTCGLGDVFSGIPWIGRFTSENMQMEDMLPPFGSSCSFEEYQKFKSFFLRLSKVAKNFFLPPQRQKFGHLYDRSFLASLGVEDSGPWSLVIYYSGCPGCSKVIREEGHILNALEMHGSPLTELVDGEQDFQLNLPVERPSVLLFVDRSSNSLAIRRRSKEALDSFKDVALRYQISYQTDGLTPSWPKKSPVQVRRGSMVKVGNPRLQVSPLSQKMKLKDKVSIMIINEGKHVPVDDVVTDPQGGQLHEILTHLLVKKQEKLSSVAKEAGFQLLSDDLDIEISYSLPDQQEGLLDLASSKPSMENLSETALNGQKDQNIASSSMAEHKEQPKPVDIEPSCQLNEKFTKKDLTKESSTPLSADSLVEDHMPLLLTNVNLDKEVNTDALLEEQNDFQGFNGSFFFSDGSYHLLRSLTNGSKVPRIVIIDPISEQHFISTDMSDFSYFSISDFINSFLNGSLLPYQRSSALESSREALHPPFVNLDFREKRSIPAVTANTFYELVLGSNQSSARAETNASNRDILVLFSSSWCGFCQRMDLVVREVYRAFKGYADVIKGQTENKKLWITKVFPDVTVKLFKQMPLFLKEIGPVVDSVTEIAVLPVHFILLRYSLTLDKVYISYDGLQLPPLDWRWQIMLANSSIANYLEAGILVANAYKEEISLSLPMIFRMDCTLNECTGVLKSMGQREFLPTLLLFPSENRTAVPYEGDITVIDIIKFIAFRGSSSHLLFEQKGILWSEHEKRAENNLLFKGASEAATYEELSYEKQKYYEVLKQIRNRQIQVRYNQMRLNAAKPTEPNVVVGSFLVATDMLLGGPFEKAIILIVSADHITGFQGLIINQHANWDSVPELEYIELLKGAPISFGGPVMHHELPLMALTRRFLKDRYPQVLPSVYFLDQLSTIREIEGINAGNRSAKHFWFFWGYSGWNWNQLFNEITDGVWSLQNGSMEDLHWP
ncbi:hypothetical protein Dimus_010016 [Dionaea muscipula]